MGYNGYICVGCGEENDNWWYMYYFDEEYCYQSYDARVEKYIKIMNPSNKDMVNINSWIENESTDVCIDCWAIVRKKLHIIGK